MSFRDYSSTPSANTALEGTFTGPNMPRNNVRQALQRLAADGRELADEVSALSGPLTVTSAPGQSVSSRMLLAAIAAPVANQSAILMEAGREGLFKFSTANLASAVSADPSQGIYVAPASDTTGASGAWVRVDPIVTPEQFGAVGDGATDDTGALQGAANAIPSTGGTILLKAGATYLVSTVNLPLDRNVELRGQYSTIKTTTGAPAIKRMPADQTAADTAVNYAVHVSGINFQGNGATGQTGLQIGATYISVVDWCHFISLETGLDMQFCLAAKVRDTRASFCTHHSFVDRFGTWTGATAFDSQSNNTIFDNCRVFNQGGALDAFYSDGCSGVVIMNCITEGGNPVNNIFFDAFGDTVVKDFTVINLHSENVPTNAIIKTNPAGGIVRVDNVFYQVPAVMIDGSGSTAATLFIVENIAFFPGGVTFNHGSVTDGNQWMFRGITYDVRNPAYWTGGIVPDFIDIERVGTGAETGAAFFVNDAKDKFYKGNHRFLDGMILGGTWTVASPPPSVPGKFAYFQDGTIGSRPLTGGGSGAAAVFQGGQWDGL